MTRVVLGKIAYGALSVAVVPAALAWWAMKADALVPLPTIPYPWGGWVLVAIGVPLIVAGASALIIHGRGLPMNPYPPPVYVTRAIYRFTPHPIYVGFGMVCFGAAMLWESPGGLWLVAPATSLAMAALVLGYERHDLRRRFGHQNIAKPLVSLPPDSPEQPTRWHRASIYILVLIPWSAAFEAVYRLGIPSDAVSAHFPLERDWPVMEWTEAVYGSVYVFVLATPLVVTTQRALRHLALTGLIATAVVTLVYLTVPVVAPPRPFEPRTILGHALMIERAMSHTVAAFPSFHVIWSLIVAEAWASRSRAWGVAGWTWAALIIVSCITTGMHALVDIAAAIVAFAVLREYRRVWRLMLRAAERVANSWREWRWGPVRVINYGAYAGLGAAVGFWVGNSLGGPTVFWPLVFIHVCGLVASAAWAQQLEGSPKLARPFGYYGGAIGGAIGAVIAGTVSGNTTMLLALIAMEGPWLQGIGRLRCLVQGCCHGARAPADAGIRYLEPRSRVAAIADLAGVPVYPTPLYSILTNVVIGVLLIRLWSLHASFGIIAGVYLLSNGIARFVEESYRGEPQTPVIGGLRLYQWVALLSVTAGAWLTTISSGTAPGLSLHFDSRMLLAGALYGLLAGAAMAIDFPASSRRFARLAPP